VSARACLLVGALGLAASPAAAQVGEVQLGAIASYGTGMAAQAGAGLVFGVAAGRVTYVGLRWTYFGTATTTQGPAASQTEVRNRHQVFALDLGVLIPKGQVEVVPEFSIGFARFAQDSRLVAGGAESADHKTELFAAPGVAVEVHALQLVLISEVQYAFAGNPELPWPAEHHGLMGSLRLVIPFEARRIRW
jgi:hypothetical protein